MATTTFLSNATINITQSVSGSDVTWDFSDQANQCTLTLGYDSLEVTAFSASSPAGHQFAPGLQSVDVSITFFLSYGGATTSTSAEVEAALSAMVGTGTTKLVISPSGATESLTNPEYTITNCMLADFTPINSTVGEIATVTANFVGGTWARDITAP
jgi:hypothetical protein